MNNNTFVNSFRNLLPHINAKRKTQLLMLLILTVFAGIVEMLSIASVVPFIKSITDENFAKRIIEILRFKSIDDQKKVIIITGLFFSILTLINSFSRCFLIYLTSRLSNIITAELNIKIYKAKLYDSYSNHIKNNSSSIISAVTQKVFQITLTLSSAINFISGIFIFICLMVVLIWINPLVMLICSFFFGALYFTLVLIGKKNLKRNSAIVNQEQNNIVINLQNGLGAIRDIILDKTQDYYLSVFGKANFKLARRQALIEFIQNSPRYLFEGLGLIFFVILLVYLSRSQMDLIGFSKIFPTLAALAIGSQRILPLLNTLYVNFAIIKSNTYQVGEIINILNEDLIKQQEKNLVLKKRVINFATQISFKNVYFSYNGNKKYVLEDINLEIKKGSRVGIIGKTGEGKSTFLDLLMGLLEPENGGIYIDNVKLSYETINSWQAKISHVPQKIFLSDTSFLENIAFGKATESIDKKKVELAAKKTQIHEYISQ
jgi:ATP-binding cassette subfamily B protein